MSKNDRKLKMITVSKNLNQYFPEDVKKVQLFNFAEGKFDLPVSSHFSKKMIGTIENCWIRIFDQSSKYYDFVSSEVYFDINDKGVYLLVSEDTKFISLAVISEMVSDFINDVKEKKMTNTQYVDRYSSLMLKEIKIASKELQVMQSAVSTGDGASRLDIEDSYEYGRNKLIMKYLLNLIASKIIKENKEAILEFISH